MMKTKLIPSKKTQPKYPRLISYHDVNNNLVVFIATKYNAISHRYNGSVIYSVSPDFKVGVYYIQFNIERTTDFDGEIILSNS